MRLVRGRESTHKTLVLVISSLLAIAVVEPAWGGSPDFESFHKPSVSRRIQSKDTGQSKSDSTLSTAAKWARRGGLDAGLTTAGEGLESAAKVRMLLGLVDSPEDILKAEGIFEKMPKSAEGLKKAGKFGTVYTLSMHTYEFGDKYFRGDRVGSFKIATNAVLSDVAAGKGAAWGAAAGAKVGAYFGPPGVVGGGVIGAVGGAVGVGTAYDELAKPYVDYYIDETAKHLPPYPPMTARKHQLVARVLAEAIRDDRIFKKENESPPGQEKDPPGQESKPIETDQSKRKPPPSQPVVTPPAQPPVKSEDKSKAKKQPAGPPVQITAKKSTKEPESKPLDEPPRITQPEKPPKPPTEPETKPPVEPPEPPKKPPVEPSVDPSRVGGKGLTPRPLAPDDVDQGSSGGGGYSVRDDPGMGTRIKPGQLALAQKYGKVFGGGAGGTAVTSGEPGSGDKGTGQPGQPIPGSYSKPSGGVQGRGGSSKDDSSTATVSPWWGGPNYPVRPPDDFGEQFTNPNRLLGRTGGTIPGTSAGSGGGEGTGTGGHAKTTDGTTTGATALTTTTTSGTVTAGATTTKMTGTTITPPSSTKPKVVPTPATPSTGPVTASFMDATGKHQVTINFTNLSGGVKAVRRAKFQEDPGRPVFDFVEIDVSKGSRCSYVASIKVAGLDASRFKFYLRDNLWDMGPQARITLKPESFPFRCGDYYFLNIYDVGVTKIRLVQK